MQPLKSMTFEEAVRKAEEAFTIVAGRTMDAIAYAETYEPSKCISIIDGTMFAPSERALPGAGPVWDDPRFDVWDAFTETFDGLVRNWQYPEDDENGGTWGLTWHEGTLFAELHEDVG